MVGIFIATAPLVASETEDVVDSERICEKREPQEPPNITWAGKLGKNLCSFQSPGKLFS